MEGQCRWCLLAHDHIVSKVMGLSTVQVLEMCKNAAEQQFGGHENHMSRVLELPLFWKRKA